MCGCRQCPVMRAQDEPCSTSGQKTSLRRASAARPRINLFPIINRDSSRGRSTIKPTKQLNEHKKTTNEYYKFHYKDFDKI